MVGGMFMYMLIVHPVTAYLLRSTKGPPSRRLMYAIGFLAVVAAYDLYPQVRPLCRHSHVTPSPSPLPPFDATTHRHCSWWANP